MPEVPGSIVGADGQFSVFFLVEKKLMTVKKFLSVAKMAPTIYETETCIGASQFPWLSEKSGYGPPGFNVFH